MFKKKEPKVFSLDDINNGKVKKIYEYNNIQDSHVEERVKIQPVRDNDGLSPELYRLLHSNPFLFNYKKADYKITSIEDFYIPVKKESKPLGEVLRDTELKYSKRKSYIKKAFKKWKSDFAKNKQTVFSKENDKLEVIGEVITNKMSFSTIALLILIFILSAFFVFRIGAFWDWNPFKDHSWYVKIIQGMADAFNVSWASLIAKITFYLIIVALFYGHFLNEIIDDYQKMSSNSRDVYNDTGETIEKNFKRKFRKTRSYYLKNIRKKPHTIAPLAIEKTATGDVDLEEVEQLTDSFIKKTADLKRRKKMLHSIRFVTLYGSYLGGIFIVIYSLYSIIVSLF